MAFSLDGKRLVSISEDGTIRHWSIDTGNELKILPCNILVGGKNNFIAFDSIGKHVVTYREEHVRVWDVDEGKEIMRVPNASISRVAFCPNGKRIGSVLTDRTIRIWDFPPLQDLIDQTRERFKDRPLTAEERRQYYLE